MASATLGLLSCINNTQILVGHACSQWEQQAQMTNFVTKSVGVIATMDYFLERREDLQHILSFLSSWYRLARGYTWTCVFMRTDCRLWKSFNWLETSTTAAECCAKSGMVEKHAIHT